MTTPFVCDGTHRELVEADEHSGPDVLYVWPAPHPLFGPKRKRRCTAQPLRRKQER